MSDASSAAHEVLFEEPYKRLLPEYESLTSDELVGINLDIPATVTTVLGVAPRLAALTARISEELAEMPKPCRQVTRSYALESADDGSLESFGDALLQRSQPLLDKAPAWLDRAEVGR